MTGFLKRVERVKAALERCQPHKVALIFTDGSWMEGTLLKLLDTLVTREDIVDVAAEDETTRSLLLAMRGPLDFSDLAELED